MPVFQNGLVPILRETGMAAYFEAEPSAADPAKDHRPESRNGHEDRAGRSDPVVEHAHEADVSTEVLEIGSYLQQCGSLVRNRRS
ncbi:MAG: hypothetical protein WA324_00340 [Bryobacteraceae bacterium]